LEEKTYISPFIIAFKNSFFHVNMTTFEQLLPLAENKTTVFYSPIEGRDVLVRTGTVEEDSLLRSVLRSHSKEYIKLDEPGRQKEIAKLQKKLNKKEDSLEKISNLLLSVYQKKEEGNVLINKLCTSKTDKEAYDILLDMVPFETVKKEVLTEKDQILPTAQKYLLKVMSGLDNKRKKFFLQKVTDLFTLILETASPTEKPLLSRLSDNLKRDLYFLDSKSRLPCSETSKDDIQNRKSIILLKLGSRYEVVGRLLPGNHIQREFETNDPIIRKINMLLFKPEMIQENYPTLLPYLKTEDKESSGSNSTHSSEREASRDVRTPRTTPDRHPPVASKVPVVTRQKGSSRSSRSSSSRSRSRKERKKHRESRRRRHH